MNRLLTIILMLIWIASSLAASKSDYNSNLNETLEIWYKKRANRSDRARERVAEISAITQALTQRVGNPDSITAQTAFDVACSYIPVNVDSAITYFKIAESMANELNIANLEALSQANHISMLVKKNVVNDRIIDLFNSIDTTAITSSADKQRYYFSAYRMHDVIQEYTAIDTLKARSLAARNYYRKRLIDIVPENKPIRNLMLGLSYFDENKPRLAIASMFMALDSCKAGSLEYASVCAHIAQVYEAMGEINNAALYATRSTLAEIESANRSAKGMIKLSELLLKLDRVPMSYDCLQDAINNSVDANDVLGVLTTTSHYYNLNLIYAEYYLDRQMHILITMAIVLLLALIDLTISIWGLISRRRNKKEAAPASEPMPDPTPEPENDTEARNNQMMINPGIWLSGCLDLYTAYIENIENFHLSVRRQIAAGSVPELLKQLKNSKNIAHNAERFAESFDQAFLQLYPTFVEDLNGRLLPDKKLALPTPDRLTNEIRVFAFMRMGIDDSDKIARLLGVSVNTVYTYRNKMRLRAIDRDQLMEFIRNNGFTDSGSEQNEEVLEP